jgi:hemolysin D
MNVLRFSQSKPTDSADLATLSFESATAEILAQRNPVRERAVLYVLGAMIVFLIVFISVVKLDRIVSTTGRVVPISGALTVQPYEKAVINRVLVAVGDVVKKGQVLATCDPTFAQANLSQLQQKVADLDAQKRRMEAEESGRPFQPKPAQSYDVLQATIWQQRAHEFSSGVADFDQRIHSAEAQVAGFRQDVADYKARLKIAAETEDMYTKLADAGVATHLQLIGVQDQKLEIGRQLAEKENDLISTQHTLESLKEQRNVYVKKWRDDNLNNLVSAKDQLQEAENDLAKANRMSELVNMVSPMDAVVLKIPDLSAGGVATDAEPLFSLMPVDAPLEVDAQIDAQDRGFVKVGDPVTIKFDAYRFLEHGIAEGVVKTISEDTFTEVPYQDTVTKNVNRDTRTPYFDARIAVKALHLHDVRSKVRLIPGMTLQADIIVGKRTIMWYLVGGALRSGREAMHEP